MGAAAGDPAAALARVTVIPRGNDERTVCDTCANSIADLLLSGDCPKPKHGTYDLCARCVAEVRFPQ